jgi:membrane protease YdiL (CAAX protease family)
VAIALVAPVPSLGVWAAMVAAPGPLGHAAFLTAKIWLVFFPALWFLVIEKDRPSWSPPTREPVVAGFVSGLFLAGAIVLGTWLLGGFRVDAAPLAAAAENMGLASPGRFLAGALAWILLNSLVEEYVYRWFILRQCELLMAPRLAIVASAAVFTAHHVIAVSRYLETWFSLLASASVFVGGLVWAWLWQRYRSVWPCWISHILADLVVFAIGYQLLFG